MVAFFRRLLGFVSELDSGRVVRFCSLGGEGVGPLFFPLEAGRSEMGEAEGFGGRWAGRMAASGTSVRTGIKAYVPVSS